MTSRVPENASSFGKRPRPLPPARFFPWRHRFAVFTAGATFVLIFVGGLVTSTGSSLAVPDWPLSYGQFFPPMVGGVLYEHGHRMVAGSVALLTAALAIWTWQEETRRSVRRLAGLALAAILSQAVLGGVTVLLRLPTAVSVAHAALAQAFFCLVVSLSLVTCREWSSPPDEQAADPWLGRLGAATTITVYLQLLVGAVMRHTGAGLAIADFPLADGRIVPDLRSFAVAIHFAHRVGALIVALMAVMTAGRAIHAADRKGRRLAVLLLILLVLQVSLGASIIWTRKAVVPTTAHVAVGAALLATSLVLTLRSYRARRAAPAWSARRWPERVPA